MKFFCTNIFPWGMPEEKDLEIIWDKQKVLRKNEGEKGSDNLLDYSDAWQSLVYKESVNII